MMHHPQFPSGPSILTIGRWLPAFGAGPTAEVAADQRLRGSGAVYAAVALQFGSTLVTLDREQKQRVAGLLPARLPGDVRGV